MRVVSRHHTRVRVAEDAHLANIYNIRIKSSQRASRETDARRAHLTIVTESPVLTFIF